eukprot:1496170-Karenia_brevis.AAC.1
MPDLPNISTYILSPAQPSSSFLLRLYKRHRNINLFPIDFTIQLRLRGRTTLAVLGPLPRPVKMNFRSLASVYLSLVVRISR